MGGSHCLPPVGCVLFLPQRPGRATVLQHFEAASAALELGCMPLPSPLYLQGHRAPKAGSASGWRPSLQVGSLEATLPQESGLGG